jgi:hypothetical protein
MDNLLTSYSISLGKSHILAVEDSLGYSGDTDPPFRSY